MFDFFLFGSQKNCGSTVRRALEALPGATRAEVSFAARRAWIWTMSPGLSLDDNANNANANTNTTVTASAAIEAIEVVGFGAELSADFELTVEGMMCQMNCGSTVKGALEAVEGVAKAEASFSESRARVWTRKERDITVGGGGRGREVGCASASR